MAYAGIGRYFVRMAPYLTGLAYDLYAASERTDAPEDFTARRCQVVMARNLSEDVVTNTYDFLNITSGAIDSSWTTADYQAVEGYLRTMYAALVSWFPSTWSVREFRWHLLPDPAGDTAARRVAPPSSSVTGSATASVPPQIACTLTKQTASRKHWGRVYLGPISQSALAGSTTSGRFSTTYVDAIAAAGNTLRSTCQLNDFPMVVYDRARLHFATVDSVRVDDIPDVIRSRRPDWVPYRKLLP